MGRPRAGHGWTGFRRGTRFITYIGDDYGQWIPSGSASGWPRCTRCRRPYQTELGKGLCITCHYYKGMTPEEFWQHKDDPFFPYTIGKKAMSAVHPERNQSISH